MPKDEKITLAMKKLINLIKCHPCGDYYLSRSNLAPYQWNTERLFLMRTMRALENMDLVSRTYISSGRETVWCFKLTKKGENYVRDAVYEVAKGEK